MKLRELKFTTIDKCIIDVEDLLLGNHRSCEWTLPEVCWHINYPIPLSLHEPENKNLTDAQRAGQEFIDKVIASGFPEGLSAPIDSIPPPNVGIDAIEEFIKSLHKLKNYTAEFVDEIVFGPMTASKYREFILAHSAHHLSFFAPNGD